MINVHSEEFNEFPEPNKFKVLLYSVSLNSIKHDPTSSFRPIPY